MKFPPLKRISTGTRPGQPVVLDTPGVMAEWGDGPLDASGGTKRVSRHRLRVRTPPRTRVAQMDRAEPNTRPNRTPAPWDNGALVATQHERAIAQHEELLFSSLTFPSAFGLRAFSGG